MIKLTNVTKVYGEGDSKTVALDNVSLEVKDGEMIAIMGPSGSGKSTLLNILGGMDNVTSGQYIFDENEVSKLSIGALDKFRKDNIAFVFQQFALIKNYTVADNIAIPLNVRNIKGSKKKETIKKVATQMGIESLLSKKATKISGGQAQRVGIARAIATGNKVILADEPTGALDLKTGTQVLDIFEELNRQGYTIIIITHDANIAKRCKRIIRIVDGKLYDEA